MFVRYELGQGLHGLFGVLALSTDGNLLALSGQPGYLQYALGVYFPIPLHDNDLRGEPFRRLYEARRRSAMDTFLRTYRRLSLSHEKLLSRQRTLYKTRHASPMIPSLALESGYGAGCRRGHKPHVRRDGDELESLPCHARGVLGRTCEDTSREIVLTCCVQHPVDSLDHLGLTAVRASSMAEALAQIRGSHEDGVQARDGENFFQVFEGLVGFDHGHGYDGLVRVVGVILAAVEGCPIRAVAAVALRRVAAGPHEGFGFLAGVDHRADHSVATSVEHTHDEARIVPRHPNDGHGISRGDSLEHRDETSIIHGPMLHVDSQAVPSQVRHYLG